MLAGLLAGLGGGGASTFAALMAGNVTASSDYSQAYWHNNAALDGRGWGPTGSTSAGGVPLDSNGYPTNACAIVISATPTTGSAIDGQLSAGTYTNCQYNSSTAALLTTPGSNGVAISAPVNQGGGVYTFTMTVSPGATIILGFSSSVQYLWIPRDGSSVAGTLPRFAAAALNFYRQLQQVRTMGVTLTNTSYETTWATRNPNYPAATGFNVSNAPSWETQIAFWNAVQAYPGSRINRLWINIPSLADTGYVTSLAALLNANLSTTLLPEFVERSNEVWNNGYFVGSWYFRSATEEAQIVANYAVCTVTSVTGNGTTATVYLSTLAPTWLTSGTSITVTNSTSTTWSSSGTVVAVLNPGGLSFTYPCAASGSMTLTDQWVVTSGSNTLVVNTVASVVQTTASTVTVTMNGHLPAFVVNGAQAVVQDASWAPWNNGTPASPMTISVTGPSTFTYGPTGTAVAAGTTLTHTDQWAMMFNLASTLVNDGLANYNVFDLAKKYYVRQLKQDHDAWVAVRPGSRFVLGLQLYGTNYPTLNLAGIMSNPSVHWKYACFLGGGIGANSKASFSWIDSVAVAPYINVTGSNVTLNQLFEPTGAAATSLYYAINAASNPTSIDKSMFAHRYMCNKYGAHAICYEGGVDLQAVSYLSVSANTDPRMGAVIKALADCVFQAGIEDTFWLELTPGNFVNGTGGTGPGDQGGWPYLQGYTDTSSPKFAAYQAYNTAVSYTNVNGAPGTLGLAHCLETSGGYIMGSGNCLHWYTGNGSERYIGYEVAINTPGTWSINIWGTDYAACNATVYVDEVLLGTMPLAVNGYGGTSNGTASASPLSVALTAGQHNIRVSFPAGVGNDPGVFQVVPTFLHA